MVSVGGSVGYKTGRVSFRTSLKTNAGSVQMADITANVTIYAFLFDPECLVLEISLSRDE